MIPKPLASVTPADLRELLASRAPRGGTLSYRVAFPATDSEDRHVLSDAAAFANGKGGDLVFGITEADGVPTEIVGISTAGLDDDLLRLRALLALGVAPRLSVDWAQVPLENDRAVGILRIGEGSHAPYALTLANDGEGTSGRSCERRIAEHVHRRVVDIAGGRTPVPMLKPLDGARIALHLVPETAMSGTPAVELSRLLRSPGRLQPMCNLRTDAEDWDSTELPDGLLTSRSKPPGAPLAYTHLSVTGIVEAVNVRAYSFERHGRWILSMHSVEEFLILSTQRYLRFLKDLGFQPPVHLFVSMIGMERAIVPTRQAIESGFRDVPPLGQPAIVLYGGPFADFSEAVDARFRKPFDTLYQMCGADQAEHFDAQGKWQRFL